MSPTLRDLIEHRAYDVPAEDVAASIIRDAIVVIVSPAHARSTDERQPQPGAGHVQQASLTCADR